MMKSMEKKILIVEDEKKIRDIISFYLMKSGYIVAETDNGNEALVMAVKEKPGLILLDIMLPGISGLEVCRRLKTNIITKDIVIIFLSAKGKISDKKEGLRLGAHEYITKPFSLKYLLRRIDELYSHPCSDIFAESERS